MSEKVFNELDPVIETFGLLYVSNNLETVKQETKKALSELGFDGEQFYAQHFKLFDKYVLLFQKYKIMNKVDEAFFFDNKDSNCFLILLALIIDNKSWLTSTEELSDELIHTQLLQTINDVYDNNMITELPDSIEGIIQFLESSDLEVHTKWKLLCILQQPRKYIEQLIGIINTNMEAYHKVVNEINKPLSKLLDQYKTSMNDMDVKSFKALKIKITEDLTVYPTLIFPVSQMMFHKSCYYGLLCKEVIQNGKIRLNSNKSLLLNLKALSDSSKLDIITSLKVSPKYNLEIAQQLGLTAATMSHHMNVLLNCGFVGIEKKDGKVYYHLEKENLKDFIEELEQTIL